jgi:tubulin-like protein CetZ
MPKFYKTNKPAINMSLVGFGQAGTRMVDKFAHLKDEEGKSIYNCLALNSNEGDLKGLKDIPVSNQVSLDLGGLGKNPTKALEILEENQDAKEKLKEFIQNRIRPDDQLVVFFAGLGGGTGTSTIIKAIEEFYDHHSKPLIKKELEKIQKNTPPSEFKTNIKKYFKQATKIAEEKMVKIGVVAALPLRADGPDALKQVNDFAQRIWKLANDRTKGIAFVMFPDNQYLYDEFNKLAENKKPAENFRDYANLEIRNMLHELNTATTGGGTEVTFDSADFRRVILEGNGCLVLSKLTKDSNTVKNGHDVKHMFLKAMENSSLHQPIELVQTKEDGQKALANIHHIGLLAILDEKKSVGSSFIDDARIEITESESFSISGTVFTGYLEEKNQNDSTVYIFYKTSGLPLRLAKGLVEEYQEYKKRQSSLSFTTTTIASIEDHDDDDDFGDIDLAEFGFEEIASGTENSKNNTEDDDEDELDLNKLDFSSLQDDDE